MPWARFGLCVVLLTCSIKDPAWTPPCGWVLGRDFGVL
jgi:hypothetical protein